MPSTLPKGSVSTPVQSLDDLRPTMAKAVHRDGQTVGGVVKEALHDYFGSLKACAIELQYDPSQLTRELDAEKLAVLKRCDAATKAFVTARVHAAFGQDDPKKRMQQLLRNVRHCLDELAEAL